MAGFIVPDSSVQKAAVERGEKQSDDCRFHLQGYNGRIMTTAEKAKYIVKVLSAHARVAAHDWIKAEIHSRGAKAMRDEWERLNPDDGVGGMSGNPYGYLDGDGVNAARRNHEECVEVMEFAIEHFLSLIPRDDSNLPEGTIRCPGCDNLAFRRKNRTVVAHYASPGNKCAVSETTLATVFAR